MIEPHRFLYVDKLTELKTDPYSLKAIVRTPKYISYLENHFPMNPIFPASLLCEMAAQHSGVLGVFFYDLQKLTVVASIKNMGVSKMIPIGSTLEVDCELTHAGDGFTRSFTSISMDGKRVFKADMTMRHVPWPDPSVRQMVIDEFVPRLERDLGMTYVPNQHNAAKVM